MTLRSTEAHKEEIEVFTGYVGDTRGVSVLIRPTGDDYNPSDPYKAGWYVTLTPEEVAELKAALDEALN